VKGSLSQSEMSKKAPLVRIHFTWPNQPPAASKIEPEHGASCVAPHARSPAPRPAHRPAPPEHSAHPAASFKHRQNTQPPPSRQPY
jgi:hypothetical protein